MSEAFSLSRIFGKPERKAGEFSRVRIAADGTLEQEGQLAVDVYQNENEIVIVAPLAGVDQKDLSLSIMDDVITIEGERRKPSDLPGENFLVQECFWGKFSRSIILPSPSENDQIKASFKNGVLQVSIPKSDRLQTKVIKIES